RSRPQCPAVKGWCPGKNIQHLSDLTPGQRLVAGHKPHRWVTNRIKSSGNDQHRNQNTEGERRTEPLAPEGVYRAGYRFGGRVAAARSRTYLPMSGEASLLRFQGEFNRS